jgi:cytochrome P450
MSVHSLRTAHPISLTLTANFDNYIKGDIFGEPTRDFLGSGIFVSDQEAWRFHRKTASNIFTTKMYRQLCEGAFTKSARDLCTVFDRAESLSPPQPVDLQQLFLNLTMDAFAELTFGIKINSLLSGGKNEFGEAFDLLTANVDSRILNPFWKIVEPLTPGKSGKMKRASAVINQHAYAAIKKRREESPEDRQKRPKDLLDHFINHVRDDGSMLSDLELRDVFVNFMM